MSLDTRFSRVALTVTAGAYSSGQCVGGKITFPNAFDQKMTGKGIIVSMMVFDLSQNGSAYDFVFFSANPVATTFTDNATLDIADGDLSKVVAVGSLLSTDAVGFNDDGLSFKHSIAIPVFTSPQTNILYAGLVCRGTPTYAATTDVTVQVAILQD